MLSLWLRSIAIAAPLTLLYACAVGPDYHRPSTESPASYKELGDWKIAQPRDHLSRGNWWEIYQDTQLTDLERQVSISNQNVRAAEAQLRQARAAVQGARAQYFPTISSAASAQRGNSSTSNGAVNNYALSVDAAWEPDMWGRVRRSVEANAASAQASVADLESVRLLAQAELAQDYFLLRVADAQRRLLDETIVGYQKSLQLTKNQYAVGVAAKVDVVQAETQLKTTQAQAIDVGVQRAQLEHAIAILAGKAASSFSIAPSPLALNTVPPPIPVGVPSQLLERRPDIAGAERRVTAANAQIGVSKAAFFPALTLAATSGFESTSLAQLFTLPSRIWSLGPALAQTLFDAGARRAQTDQAIAAYDASVAIYRQAVLNGFQEVEDNIAALRILEQEAQVQGEAVKDARQVVAITSNQYKAGTVSYLNVVTAQSTALSNERTALTVLSSRLTASVLLIKALGGGWNTKDLPTAIERAR